MGHTRPAALPAIAGYRVLVVDGTTRSALVVLSKGLAPVRWGRGGFFRAIPFSSVVQVHLTGSQGTQFPFLH